jgi:MFS family permease
MIASALIGCVSGGVLAWSAPYVMRTLHAPMGAVGLYLGLAAAVSGCLSAVVGGLITDRWKRRDARAPVWMGLIAVFAPIPFLVLMMRAQDLQSFVAAYFGFGLLSLCWSGGFGAIVMDLVLPRMRATASATFSLITVLLSSGLGPYWAGKISTLTGSLTTGLYSLLVLVPVTAILLLLAAGRLRAETGEARRARAAAAGEIL